VPATWPATWLPAVLVSLLIVADGMKRQCNGSVDR
jgi:hypothetical protein